MHILANCILTNFIYSLCYLFNYQDTTWNKKPLESKRVQMTVKNINYPLDLLLSSNTFRIKIVLVIFKRFFDTFHRFFIIHQKHNYYIAVSEACQVLLSQQYDNVILEQNRNVIPLSNQPNLSSYLSI